MNKLKFFATLCCAALLFAACDKDNEPKNDNDTSNDTKSAVDLGLSVKWATCNVGATSPEEYGNQYAWGEIETKGTYSWNAYKYGTADKLTKYNATDKKTTLEAADDVAAAKWGGAWRMPTDAEWKELVDKCTWTWTTLNGKNGYEVKSKTNEQSIFLPATGCRGDDGLIDAGSYGAYWSSSLNTDDRTGAQSMYFYSTDGVYRNYCIRYFGGSVRPVCK